MRRIVPVILVALAVAGGHAYAASLVPSTNSLNFYATAGTSVNYVHSFDVAASSGALTFSASASSSGWLYVSPGNLTTPQYVTPEVSSAGLIAGTYSGTITLTCTSGSTCLPVVIDVTFSVVQPIYVNQPNVTLNAATGTTTAVTTSVNVMSPGAFTSTVQPGAPWLTVSPGSSTTSATLTISANPTSLAANTYTGTINIVAAVGSSTSVTVTLIVAPPITVCDPNGNCSPAQQPSLQLTVTSSRQSASANLTVTSAAGTIPFTVTYQTQSGGSWLFVPSSGNATTGGNSLTVTASSGELPPGNYSGTLTITGGGTSVTVAVTLTLQGNPIIASPNQLTVNVPAGQKSSLQNVNLTFFQPGSAALTPANTYLLLSVASGSSGTLSNLTLSGAVNVGVDATSLTAGTQLSSSIAVQCVNTNTCFDTAIAVTVNVTAPPALQLSPASVTFLVTAGTKSQAGSVNLTATGGAQLSWSATAPSWIKVGTSSGTASSTATPISISVDATSLSPGSTTGNVTFSCVPSSACAPINLQVTANVSAAVTLSANPSSVSFTAYTGRGNPPAKTVTIGSSDGSALSFTVSGVPAWLNVSALSGTTGQSSGTLTLTPIASAAPANGASATLTLTPGNSAPTSSLMVSISFTPFTISANPAPLNISVVSGQTQTAMLSIGTVDSAPALVNVAVSGLSALTVSGSQVTAPGAITVTLNAASLQPGMYPATITLTCAAANPCAAVPVTVQTTVTAAAALQLSQSSLTIPVTAGTLSQATSVNLTATGGAQLSWSATAPSWIRLGTASGTASSTPTPISITVDATSLSPGSTVGTVTVGCVNSSSCAPVSLQVTAVVSSPGPAVSGVTPPSATAGGPSFTLTVNGAGFVSGSIVEWNGSSVATSYISINQLSATIPAALIASTGSVSVTVTNPGGQASSAAVFTITAASSTAPAITSINPSSATTGGPSLTVTVTGSGFVSGASVRWNGLALSTNFVSATTLAAQIPAGDLLNPGTGQITVDNPSGQGSNSVPFLVSSTSALQFMPVAPCRVLDTRLPPTSIYPANSTFGSPYIAAGTVRSIPIPASTMCPVPSNAAAWSLNFTVQPRTTSLGSLTVWPAGTAQPNVSTLSFSNPAVVLAAAGIVPAGAGGAINATATQDVDLIVDINGYFVPPGAGTLQFYPLPPCRVLDTRTPANGGTFPANTTFGSPSLDGVHARSFPIPSSNCGAPASAAAFSFNVGVVPQGALYFLAAYPTGGTLPVVSTMNSFDGTILANAAIVPAGPGGAVNFFASNPTDFFVDINGYFAPPGPGGLNFYTVSPCRLVDTRNANGTFGGPTFNADMIRSFPLPESPCGIPSGTAVQAYSLSITVYPIGGGLYYLTTWPTGEPQPFASTLNAIKPLLPIANAALVPAGTGGGINVFVTNPTDVTIDTAGYFGP